MARLLRLLVLAALALGVAAATPGPVEGTHLKMIVGVTDDTGKWMTKQDGIVGVHRDLGLMAVRVTVPWRPGQVKPTKLQRVYIRRITQMSQRDRIILAVYNRAEYAPTTVEKRTQYCSFLRGVFARIPRLMDAVIWNEANNPEYWPQSAGAPSYELLLEQCWDVLHSYRLGVRLLSSTAPSHDPEDFILDLGATYRSHNRVFPIFEFFGHNAYPKNAAEPPWAKHDDGYIGEGDYDRLMSILHKAFDGTAQPVPSNLGNRGVAIWYSEVGFQTVPVVSKRRFYRGRENDSHVLTPMDQVTQLQDAVRLAYCQPAVAGFLNFALLDEDKLGGWQSGLLWRDGTRKPSYDVFKQLIADARAAKVDCANVKGAPPPEPKHQEP